MATKGVIKDAQGNILHAESSADVIKRGADSTVDADLTTLETKVGTLETTLANKKPVQVKETIAERDGLADAAQGDMVLVKDATGDDTVTAGAALYIHDGSGWQKIAEYESLDVALEWAAIQNKEVDFAVVENGAGAPANLAATGIYFEKAAAVGA